jgi:tRNA pseudouridine55 synthase
LTSGILNISKPAGPSSFAVVRSLRRLPGVHRLGHGGTLDPAADGVLPVLIGAATRLADFVHEWPKTYVATAIFGFVSTTGDREGTIQPSGVAVQITAEQIEAILPRFTGCIEQVPPMFSALKQGGEALYHKARRGETVERKPRAVDIYALRLLDYDAANGSGRFEVTSGRGMYVRSLVHDLGEAIGCGAYLSQLTRVAVGPLHLNDAVGPAAVAAAGAEWARFLLPMDLPLRTWPAMDLDANATEAIQRGQSIEAPALASGRYRLLDPTGRLVGWGEVDETNRVRPRAVFAS